METNENAAERRFIGRESELLQLHAAIRNRESLLIWGAADAGKTALVRKAMGELPQTGTEACIYWSGPASVRQLAEQLVRRVYAAGDSSVRAKMRKENCKGAIAESRWFRERSSGQLKALLYSAAQKARYSIFLDHMPAATRAVTRLIKEIIWRCKTPVYWIARGSTQKEIGYAWSIYFARKYHMHVGPLPGPDARHLLKECISRFGLASLELEGFREDVLHMSRCLPGTIAKMCELSANPRYHCGRKVKLNLVRVDYLMQSGLRGDEYPTVWNEKG